MRSLRTLALAGVLLACASTRRAQQSVDYASVSGRVTDPSGAVVPGAQVTVRHTETNLGGTTLTDQEGRFRFPYLRVGPYEIAVRADRDSGMRRAAHAHGRRRVRTAGDPRDRRPTETVTVDDEAAVLEAARSQIAGTVSQAEVRRCRSTAATSWSSRS